MAHSFKHFVPRLRTRVPPTRPTDSEAERESSEKLSSGTPTSLCRVVTPHSKVI